MEVQVYWLSKWKEVKAMNKKNKNGAFYMLPILSL